MLRTGDEEFGFGAGSLMAVIGGGVREIEF
jgi:hypothetical protein